MPFYDGSVLAAARKKKSLTQEQIAKVLGIGRRQISQMENGTFEGGIKYLEKYLRALNLRIDLAPTNPHVECTNNINETDDLAQYFTSDKMKALNEEIDALFKNNEEPDHD